MQNAFKKQLADSTSAYIDDNKKVREKRLANPFFNEVLRYRMDNKVYSDYEGVDTLDGRILNLNRVNEVDSIEDETLYSAFMQKRDNKEEAEIRVVPKIPNGFPILFVSETKIEEIAENENNEQVKSFLDFISQQSTKDLDLNEMRFIGSLDKDGKIEKTTENCSHQIRRKIQVEQEKYKEKIESIRHNSKERA